MRQKNWFSKFLSVFLIVLIPAVIVLLSSAVVLHMPQPYEYYFNDSESLSGIGYGVEVSEMGKEIADYFRMPSDEPFQVYERNGEYEDPIFSDRDQEVMKKAAEFLWKETLLALALTVLAVLVFWNTKRKKLIDPLRVEGWIASILTVLLQAAQFVLLSSESFRHVLYQKLIGISLPRTSNLYVILGNGEFAGVYLMFQTIIAAALLVLFAYIVYKSTRPERVFYVRKRF